MVCSFGEGRGSIPSLQIDYPSHVAVDRKTSSDDAGVGTDLGTSDLCTGFGTYLFIYLFIIAK